MGSSMALALAGFCFSVLFIVFVCTRLACALLRRRRRSGARSRRAAATPTLPQHYAHGGGADPDPFPFHVHHHHHAAAAAAAAASPGLDPAAVAAFRTRAYHAAARDSPDDDDDGGDSQCVICLAEYEEKDVLRILPYCSHNFHMACIDLWLEQNSTCPVCRISLLVLDNPESEHTAHPPPPAPPPLSSIVISPPSSPESSRSDPCRCLFVSSGHSSRASEVLRHEPDQENQVASGPSVDGANSLPLPEGNPPPENNSQTVRKQVDRSTQLGPCK